MFGPNRSDSDGSPEKRYLFLGDPSETDPNGPRITCYFSFEIDGADMPTESLVGTTWTSGRRTTWTSGRPTTWPSGLRRRYAN